MTTLTLQKLSKEYFPGDRAVSDLNLRIDAGELMVLLGPSGCGKTTTLRLIAGLLQPSSGDVLFDGNSVLELPPERRGAVMVFQEHTLFPFMSVGENVAYGLKMRKLPVGEIEAKVTEALMDVQLPGFAERSPASLSSGQRQRAALARALVVRPRLLLLDEPLSNLDPSLREELRQVVRTLQQQAGITTIFVTHDQAEAMAVADRIALMVDGRIKQVGHPREFFENPVDAQVARFFGSSNFLQGVKRGSLVHTAMGELEIGMTAVADGPVLLAIRPEVIEIGANGHNNFPAQVQSCRYGRPASQCLLAVGKVQLEMVTSPYQDLSKDQPITVHLPKNRIQVLSG